MPNAKAKRKARNRRERRTPSYAQRVLKDVLPFLRAPRLPRTRSARHMVNASIEFLEAMRALIDEAIDWLRREGRSQAELKRIRVEG